MTENPSYFERMKLIKLGLLPKEAVAKAKKPLKKVSDKKAAEIKESKDQLGENDTIKEKWFKNRRGEMVGVCQCGCGEPSSKSDPKNFRSSICHIFPQRLFPSIQFHPVNWVERKFWATNGTSACHTNMDIDDIIEADRIINKYIIKANGRIFRNAIDGSFLKIGLNGAPISLV